MITLTTCTQRQQVASVAVSPSGARLAVGTRDSGIRVLDTASGKLVRQGRGTGPFAFSQVTWSAFAGEDAVLFVTHGRVQRFDVGSGTVGAVADCDVLDSLDCAAGLLAYGGGRLRVVPLSDPAAARSAGAGDRVAFDRVALAPGGEHVAGVRTLRDGYDFDDEELHVYDTATMTPVLTTGLGPESYHRAHRRQIRAALGFVSGEAALARVEAGCVTFDEEASAYRQIGCADHPAPPGPATVRFVGLDGSERRGAWPDGFRPRQAAFTADAVYGLAHGRVVRMDARTLATTALPGATHETAVRIAVSAPGAVAAVANANRRDVTLLRYAAQS